MGDKQLLLIKWSELRASGQSGASVGDDLRVLLSAEDIAAEDAYYRLENPVVSQGHLFQCAPAVVSVIVAAVADETIPRANLASCLDLLGRILGGSPDESEVALGLGDLKERCHQEAMRGYWALMRVAQGRDEYNAWQVAASVLLILDATHSARFLG
jgi:hypothetical protein